MALASTHTTTSTADTGEGVDAPDLQIFVFALFFIFGGITSLNDVIIPKLKDLFTLNYFQALLVQSAFFEPTSSSPSRWLRSSARRATCVRRRSGC